MQYVTEDGIVGFFNCDERVIISKAKEIAYKYFCDNPEVDTFSMCLYDFDQMTSSILAFTIERNITVSKY